MDKIASSIRISNGTCRKTVWTWHFMHISGTSQCHLKTRCSSLVPTETLSVCWLSHFSFVIVRWICPCVTLVNRILHGTWLHEQAHTSILLIYFHPSLGSARWFYFEVLLQCCPQAWMRSRKQANHIWAPSNLLMSSVLISWCHPHTLGVTSNFRP